ncbi:hypothetical protein BDY24DRAFT_345205 [Mrakia frigida]|uniref:PPIL2 family peptidylprolyl isomerase n=1 Tax=Mrakia frigida TaxID=29902 RepID=UPI003FCBFCCF
MGKNTDKMYITHTEHAAGGHTAGGGGFQGKNQRGQHAFQSLPFDCCALSLQPFDVPVAVREEDGTASFDLVNILPYVKKHGTNPVTGRPLATSDLIKLNFFRNSTSNICSDPVTFKPFGPHSHIVFLANTGNVFSYESIERLCIKAKSWRDLVNDEPFTRKDIVTIQDPHNLSARDLTKFDYVKTGKTAVEAKEVDRLSGINVGASGSAARILEEVAKKNTPAPPPPVASGSKPKVGVVAVKPRDTTTPYNAAAYSTGRAAASFTSTAENLETKSERALIDEEEFMFDEMTAPTKEKDKVKKKAFLRINTNMGSLNYELHCDKAPKTCYNFLMLAKEGKYDDTIFHRNIPGFMIQGGDPTGTGKGGSSYWGHPFRDEYEMKGALKHEERGTMSMANSGAGTNGAQFFLTFRKTPHLDNKHTVFGGLVGGMEVLNKIESIPSDKATDRPLREIKIINIEIFQNPFETYQTRLSNKLAPNAKLASTTLDREKTRLERESDRTSWFGEDLDKQRLKADEEQHKHVGVGVEGLVGARAGVGKYLGGAAVGGKKREKDEGAGAFGGGGGPEKKKRKGAGGGFGDFSGW